MANPVTDFCSQQDLFTSSREDGSCIWEGRSILSSGFMQGQSWIPRIPTSIPPDKQGKPILMVLQQLLENRPKQMGGTGGAVEAVLEEQQQYLLDILWRKNNLWAQGSSRKRSPEAQPRVCCGCEQKGHIRSVCPYMSFAKKLSPRDQRISPREWRIPI